VRSGPWGTGSAGRGAAASGAGRTSTDSTSGTPARVSRTSSGALAVARSAASRAPPFFCNSCCGDGSSSSSVPSPLSLRWTMSARAPGAWQLLATVTKTSRRGSAGSATTASAAFGSVGELDDRIQADRGRAPLDGMDLAEDRIPERAAGGLLLEPHQLGVQLRERLAGFGNEERQVFL